MTLKQARKKCGGYTQTELANLLGVTCNTILSWEKGRTSPTMKMCLEMCKIFGIDPKDLQIV